MGEISDPTETTSKRHALAVILGVIVAGLMAFGAVMVPHVPWILALILLALTAVLMGLLAGESYLRLRAGDWGLWVVAGSFVVLGLAIAVSMLILNAANVA